MDKKKLYLLCACIFPLMVCSGVIYSMFSLYLYETLKAGKSQIGLIYMCGSLSGFLSASFVGSLADRLGRRTVIIFATAAFAVVFLLYSFLRSYKYMYGVQALEGIAWVSIGAAANAYIADIIAPERRGWAMGIYQKTMSLGWVVGPAVGGFLFETIGFQMTFLVGAAVTGLSTIPVFILVKEAKR